MLRMGAWWVAKARLLARSQGQAVLAEQGDQKGGSNVTQG